MSSGHWNILIIGIGPVGLAVALSFLKHPNTPSNVRLTLIDASPSLSLSGAVGLTRNGLHVLSELGVHPDGQFVRAIFMHDSVSKKILQALSVPKGATLMVERFELAQQLLEEARKVGGERVEVVWSKKFKSADELDGGRVRVELDGGEKMDVDLLVGADGVRSRVRDFVLGDGDWTPFFTGYVSVYGVSEPIEGADDEHVGASRWIINRNGIGGYESWDLPQRRQYWHIISVSEHPRGTASAPRPTPEDITQELEQYRSAWHPIPGGFAAIIGATILKRVIKTPILSRFYEKLHNDRGTAVLVGDAAHPIIPAIGQGVNMGLEDAIVLANALLSATHDGVPRGTAWYTSQRVERIRKVGEQSAFMVKIVMSESMVWRWVRYLGTLVMRLLPRPKDFVEWDVVDEITSEQAAMGPFGWIHGWKVKLGE